MAKKTSTVLLRLEPDFLVALDERRGDIPRAAFIRRCLEREVRLAGDVQAYFVGVEPNTLGSAIGEVRYRLGPHGVDGRAIWLGERWVVQGTEAVASEVPAAPLPFTKSAPPKDPTPITPRAYEALRMPTAPPGSRLKKPKGSK